MPTQKVSKAPRKKAVRKPPIPKKTGKRKGGAPKFEVKAADVKRWAAEGGTQNYVASKIGISVDTLKRRFKEDPKLREIYYLGKAGHEVALVDVMNEIAFDETAPRAERLKAAQFMLERKHGFNKTDNIANTHANPDGSALKPLKFDVHFVTSEQMRVQQDAQADEVVTH